MGIHGHGWHCCWFFLKKEKKKKKNQPHIGMADIVDGVADVATIIVDFFFKKKKKKEKKNQPHIGIGMAGMVIIDITDMASIVVACLVSELVTILKK